MYLPGIGTRTIPVPVLCKCFPRFPVPVPKIANTEAVVNTRATFESLIILTDSDIRMSLATGVRVYTSYHEHIVSCSQLIDSCYSRVLRGMNSPFRIFPNRFGKETMRRKKIRHDTALLKCRSEPQAKKPFKIRMQNIENTTPKGCASSKVRFPLNLKRTPLQTLNVLNTCPRNWQGPRGQDKATPMMKINERTPLKKSIESSSAEKLVNFHGPNHLKACKKTKLFCESYESLPSPDPIGNSFWNDDYDNNYYWPEGERPTIADFAKAANIWHTTPKNIPRISTPSVIDFENMFLPELPLENLQFDYTLEPPVDIKYPWED